MGLVIWCIFTWGLRGQHAIPNVNGYFIMVEHLSCETMKDFLEVLVKREIHIPRFHSKSEYQVKEGQIF